MRTRTLGASLALGAGLVLCVAGCGRKPTTEPDATPAPAVDNFGDPPTEEEARAFGKQLEAAVASGDREATYRLFRIDDLLERSISDLKMSDAERRDFLAQAQKRGLSKRTPDQILLEMQKGATFRFLRVRSVDGRPRVLMRFLVSENSANYVDFLLARFPDGTIGSEDIYFLSTGERMSQTLRRIILTFPSGKDGRPRRQQTPLDAAYRAHIDQLGAMTQDIRQGRNKNALAIYRQLPDVLQKDKMILIAGMTAASEEDEADYLRLLDRYRQEYPNDPGSDLFSIDYFLLKKQFEQALACIDRLERGLGGDPFLHVKRAVVFFEAGRRAEAQTAINKAIKEEPTLQAAYFQRVTFALKEKNYADVLTWLQRVVERCGVALDQESMRRTADYADFVTSPQFVELWMWYGARKK